MIEPLSRRLRAYAEKDGRGYPDWAVRYLPVVRRLRKRGFDRKIIVEVGANEHGLASFIPARVIAVDLDIASLRAASRRHGVLPVVADMAALPFPDHIVDICVCMDAFEHVARPEREAAAREIVRILEHDGAAAISFPSGREAAEAEERVREAYRTFTGESLRWLEEHRAQGLPEARPLHDFFHDLARGAYRVTRFGNASVHCWEWMWKVLMCGWPGRGNSVFQVFLRWMTPFLARMHKEPCYRTIIWIEPTKDLLAEDAFAAVADEEHR